MKYREPIGGVIALVVTIFSALTLVLGWTMFATLTDANMHPRVLVGHVFAGPIHYDFIALFFLSLLLIPGVYFCGHRASLLVFRNKNGDPRKIYISRIYSVSILLVMLVLGMSRVPWQSNNAGPGIFSVDWLQEFRDSRASHHDTQEEAERVILREPFLGLESASDWDVTFLDENSSPLILSDLKGQLIFVHFWATWCPPCRQELPQLASTSAETRDEMRYLFVSAEDPKVVKTYLDELGIDIPYYSLEDGYPSWFYGSGLPTTFVFGPGGELVFRQNEAADWDVDTMRKLIDSIRH